MNPHSIAVSAIEAAIETMLLPGSGPVEDAKAETLVVAYFSILVINCDEFKHYCERIRRIADRRKEAA
ncbi:hypothetical protein [Pseudomonas guariconensis]|uniref:hypothetical protein n=1 Tax=Pseudomonas guariconensis TaxID=1288410 RepID=UPI002D1E8E23|nr:hypothetical protein [Pseudomonas guariconensis]MEB3840509.1 hypothetical protein [Pseudomonas guariconensis]MEB3873377.1 hypothetical protein [Pseudomonas guariconensis]MEB3879744.1 hypothetical protein [Pseudomonas guariconensis]MEB3895800.1 hypothetical protein [Pseudomonas guariconensis]